MRLTRVLSGWTECTWIVNAIESTYSRSTTDVWYLTKSVWCLRLLLLLTNCWCCDISTIRYYKRVPWHSLLLHICFVNGLVSVCTKLAACCIILYVCKYEKWCMDTCAHLSCESSLHPLSGTLMTRFRHGIALTWVNRLVTSRLLSQAALLSRLLLFFSITLLT